MLQYNDLKSSLLKRIIVGVHIVAWLIFFQISFDLTGLYYGLTDLIFHDDITYFDEAFILIPFILILFYWNSQYLIPKYITLKSWLKYIIYLALSYFLCSGLSIFVFQILIEFGWDFRLDHEEFEDIVFTMYLIIILASLGRGITKLALSNAQQAKEARERYKEAELNYLQAQINPHFIFNSLNMLYALSDEENATQTTNAILKFSELMRYPMYEGSKSLVPLEKELIFIENFIDLQRLKLGDDYPIVFNRKGNYKNIVVIPLCFIPIVENAFKYGVSQRYKSEISFNIYQVENNIYFESENELNSSSTIKSHKIGIENLKQRLELVYKGKSQLTLHQSNNTFKVKLVLPIS